MQFEIKFDEKLNPALFDDFARFIYQEVLNEIKRHVSKSAKHYRVRESSVINCTLLKWKGGNPPTRINLLYYVSNCLVLEKTKDSYVIKLNDAWVVKGAVTKVSTLVRILEYGTDKIPPYPLVRRVLSYYSRNYKELFTEFAEKRLFEL